MNQRNIIDGDKVYPVGLDLQPLKNPLKNERFKMSFLTNWKTTLAGIASIITGIVSIVNGNMQVGISTIIVGLGLIMGKDYNK